jgi:hypothetical protein
MATIRTTCPGCEGREVDLPSEAILLMFREEDREGTYAFVCPECEALQCKPAEVKIATLLMCAGVPRISA